MNESTIIADQIQGISQKFLGVVQEILPNEYNETRKNMESDVLPLLDIKKPKIMVYGIYNSGKSTLINAILKEERAKMADRPQTDSIDEYDAGNYILVDAPGVDAPIEHEKVTNEYLSKCHIILFVMSSKGGFESKENYWRLLELINKNIPFIIVLNERSMGVNSQMSEEEKRAIQQKYQNDINGAKRKIIKNLVDISDESITRKYEVVNLDAKKALVGIQKNKMQLFDVSNVNVLEDRIEEILYSNREVKKLFMQPLVNLREKMQDAEKQVFQKYEGIDKKDYANIFNIIQLKKENVLTELQTIIKELVSNEKMLLSSAIEGNDSVRISQITEEIGKEYNDSFAQAMQRFYGYLQKNFQEMCGKEYSFQNGASLSSEGATDEIDYNINTTHQEYSSKDYKVGKSDKGTDSTTEVAGALSGIILATPLPVPIKIAATVAVNVISFVADIFSSSSRKEEQEAAQIDVANERYAREAEQRAAEQMRIQQEVRNATNSYVGKIEKSLYSHCLTEMDQIVNTILASIQKLEHENEENAKKCTKETNRIKELQSKLMKLEQEIL